MKTEISSLNKEKKARKQKKQNEKEILHDFYCSMSSVEPTTTNEKQLKHQSRHPFTTPKNANQEHLLRILNDRSKKIVFVTGPAGTGKTLFATETGIQYWLSGTYKKMVFTRPNISVDEELGYLPGTLEEKLGPYVRPIYDVLYNYVEPHNVSLMIEDKTFEISPLGFMRGRTFKNTWIVADEMQNATISQMKMLLTRIGENSKLIITGDLEQSDIGHENGLKDFLKKWTTPSQNMIHLQFTHGDVLRESVVQEILDIYNA